ncbi:hypothetical protein [Rhizobium sp. EC-SD404]|uniref:hypothetical protein n=1 Tax=Rhizobium sp. EC-SD404 TaxID=2038389 RepID=UPI00125F5C34|nr:hypothetical protein [Rhizobium sp. EC-SD404]
MGLSPGDIVEIRTDKGLAYLQVTHDHRSYPQVVRALEGLHPERPSNIEEIAATATLFSALLPLGSMLDRGAVAGERIGCAAIPESDRNFPTFKTPIRDKTGAIAYWWYWDGEGLRYDVEPREATDSMPMREVMTARTLLERLAEA